jgi:hypothetical protein
MARRSRGPWPNAVGRLAKESFGGHGWMAKSPVVRLQPQEGGSLTRFLLVTGRSGSIFRRQAVSGDGDGAHRAPIHGFLGALFLLFGHGISLHP